MARVLFIHGFLGSPNDWDGIISHYSHHDCHALHLPVLPGCENIAQYSQQLWQQLDEQKIVTGDVHLVGYSMGARLAMHWLNKPQVCSALLEAGHPGAMGFDTTRFAHDQVWAKKLMQLSPFEFLSQWYQQPIFANQDGLALAKQSQHLDPAQQAYLLTTLSVARQQDCTEQLAQKPVTYLTGEYDRKYQAISQQLPVNRRITVLGAGHNVHLSQPGQYLTHLTEHLREHYYDKPST